MGSLAEVRRRGDGPLKKSERRAALVRYLEENPFATDEQLAEHFRVSVATIRLDRASLNIPEARARILQVAAGRHDALRAMDAQDVIGEIVELHLNRYAVSRLVVGPGHVFGRTGIVRGHVLFGQVNSLAVAMMDADVAVTAKAEIRFLRPVRIGETLVARAHVVATQSGVAKCEVHTKSGGETVLDGYIWVSQGPSAVHTPLD
ncbi:fatty acid biosynthesis transcriptional regulator [Alicyclobacillus cellulosilyticus]|uniref:Fatty acid biosynthesis transcriptional regulator n=1 Tax=Alicyclobacillus cellulosilyticus TaxID=1003997 RepID=A0A917NKS3_9BACL|nr:transcription factor FapR [Alicyclobacillus cellulosilyticus]GGJ08041.1 fatty acid biosynthesis transcriptional regulator [Alicyclobacillus cellulosilyticus]